MLLYVVGHTTNCLNIKWGSGKNKLISSFYYQEPKIYINKSAGKIGRQAPLFATEYELNLLSNRAFWF